MQHLDMQTPDGNQLNLDALYKICPSCFTESKDKEGNLKRVVDWTKLRALLGDNAVEDAPEVYDFTWVGKRAAQCEAAKPINKTLRPCPEESVDWDTTQNLYIEGDNLEVLKLLQNSYMGKVKMIYIDPPYNTGNDFVYHDDFAQSAEEYKENDNNEEGKRFRINKGTEGRFHSDWCSMMYSRLMVARSLLREDGVIFISIDDNEVRNLRHLCDEVFGEQNFHATVVWQKKYAATNDSKGFSTTHDYIVVYQKSNSFKRNLLPRTPKQNEPYKNDDNDGRGLWRSDNLLVKSFSQSGVYPITNPNTGKVYLPPKGSCWRASKETMETWLNENRIFFGKDGKGAPQLKRYFNEVQQGRVPITWWDFEEVGHNDEANKELSSLFRTKTPFDTPKPVRLLMQTLRIGSDKESLILDFFSGSATTAHACMKLNAEDGGTRKYIMVQINEKPLVNSEAYNQGYVSICELAKERIKRASNKIREDLLNEIKSIELQITIIENAKPSSTTQLLLKEDIETIAQKIYTEQVVPLLKKKAQIEKKLNTLDTGFRVLKCDESNMKDVYFSPKELQQGMLDFMEDNIKEDRSNLDLLFDCMLRWGVELSLPMTTTQVDGCTIHNVNDGDLLACFTGTITDKVISAIAAQHPLRIVFRDSSFTSASQKMNLFEQFKQHLSWSDQEVRNNVKVI